MIIGLGLDGRLGLSVDELGELGKEAAQLGFESLWTPAGGVPDAFHVCARWAEETKKVTGKSLRLGTGVVPAARSWNPLSLAAEAGTLGQLSGGQFVLGIGTGGYGADFFASVKMPNRPIAVMDDYLDVLHGLLAGETVSHDGPALQLSRASLGASLPDVPVYLAALGSQMLHLAGRKANGVSLNWASPESIAWSAEQIGIGAKVAGRSASDVVISMYIRICIDEDVDAARRAFAGQVLGYGLARPGQDKALGYRGHFGRMGFEEVFSDLESRRENGASLDDLIDLVPDELLLKVGYFGAPAGAAKAYAALSEGLDETIVRVIGARPGLEAPLLAMRTLTPSAIRAAVSN